jgi:broad specificity phosphatase PhoE
MSQLRRIVLVRHGETEGESSVRFHGSTDVALSAEGRAQMRRVAGEVGEEPIDLVAASPLRRSWEAATLVGGGRPVRLVPGFREIHFGAWEGLTREEIQARDPILYEDWQGGVPGFQFPGGEPREAFRERVALGLGELRGEPARNALVVVHKGVIRVIVETLSGKALERDEPALGEVVTLTRDGDRDWYRGRRTSDPPGLAAPGA